MTRLVLLVLVIVMLLAGSFWTLLPFLGGLIWAATVVIATWPLLLRLRARTGKRPWIAVAIMTGVILLAVILPFGFAVSTLLDVAHRGPEVLGEYFKNGPRPSARVVRRISRPSAIDSRRSWQELAAGGREGLIEAARPYAGAAAHLGHLGHRRHRHGQRADPADRRAGGHPVRAG